MDVPFSEAGLVTGDIEMVPVPATGPGAYGMDEEDSEWEYEYDANETEDFYFTLDLTTHVPDAVPLTKVSRNGKKTPRDADNAENNPMRAPGAGAAAGDYAQAQKPPGTLQFLDLHSLEPIVSFNEGVYKCQWHTDLGTQCHVSRVGATAKPTRAGNVLDVVGVSRVRLLGRPVTLRQRADWVDETTKDAATNGEGAAQTASAEPQPAPNDLSGLRPGQQLVVPRNLIRNPNMEAQASFFERLSAIKLKKGEKDLIPVGGVRQYHFPAKKKVTRKQVPAPAEAQEPSATETTEAPTKSPGKRKSVAESPLPEQTASPEPTKERSAAEPSPAAEQTASPAPTKAVSTAEASPAGERTASPAPTKRKKRTYAELGKETQAEKAKRLRLEGQASTRPSPPVPSSSTVRPAQPPSRISRPSTPSTLAAGPSSSLTNPYSGPSFTRGVSRLATPGEGARPSLPSQPLVQYSTPAFSRPTSSSYYGQENVGPAIPWHLLSRPSQSPQGSARPQQPDAG